MTGLERRWRYLPWYLRATLLAYMGVFERPWWWSTERWLGRRGWWAVSDLPRKWLDVAYWLADRRGEYDAPYHASWLLRYSGYRRDPGDVVHSR